MSKGFSKKNFDELNVEKKLTIMMVRITAIIIAVLVSYFLVRNTTSTYQLVTSNFSNYADLNATRVETKLETARGMSNNVATYITSLLNDIGTIMPDTKTSYSHVYKELRSEQLIAAEQYIFNSIIETVVSNPLIEEIGVYFEPNQFEPDQEAYAFSIDSKRAKLSMPTLHTEYNSYSTEEFYTEVIRTGETFVTSPYIGINGEYVIKVAVPMIKNGQVIGVVATDILTTEFIDTVIYNEAYPSLSSSILDTDLNFAFSSDTSHNIGINIGIEEQIRDITKASELVAQGELFVINTVTPTGENYARYFAPIDAFGQVWWATVAVTHLELYKTIVVVTMVGIVFSVVALLLSTMMIKKKIKSILGPLKCLEEAVLEMEAGNLGVEVNITHYDDIGRMIEKFNSMGKSLNVIVKDIEYMLTKMSNGKFKIEGKFRADYKGDFIKIKEAITSISADLKETLSDVSVTANELSQEAEAISLAATHLSDSTTEEMNAINKFVITTEKMEKNTQMITQKACKNNKMGKIARDSALASKEDMEEMLKAMDEISASSRTISSVLTIIQSIADQTNLLALNAAIEAARAGSSGKGFAVVAKEIRDLSNQSSVTVKRIEGIIKTSLKNVERGQDIAIQTAEKLLEVSNTIEETVDISQELTEMSEKQQIRIGRLLDTIKEISVEVNVNATSAEESTAISKDLERQAIHLANIMEHFKF